MKVFISSTCYDLLDLRAELHEGLRDLGVEALFSDLKESDFVVSSAPDVNSIETCLANLRESDVVVVVLSQRYGPKLGGPFGEISATHCEYNEARRLNKPLYFYVRDRLDADCTTWRRNGGSADFTGAWCFKEGTKGLFAMIEAHRQLVGPDGKASANNWYSTFTTSVDLRADLRRRLAPAAVRATAENLIKAGQVPILLIVGQGVGPTGASEPPEKRQMRFTFDLVNAGSVAAMSVQGDLVIAGVPPFGGNSARVGVVLPGTEKSVPITFDVLESVLTALFGVGGTWNGSPAANVGLTFAYTIPTGHKMADHFEVSLVRRGEAIEFIRLPDYGGKSIAGMTDYIQS
jgi:hypothetical protein